MSSKYEPLISIIVPVYNAEKYLTGCLDSILAQTYRNTEIIAINDGSTDGSQKILNKYKGRNNVTIISQKNKGVSAARNLGIEHAKGDYIMFVDADDWLDTSAIATLIKQLTHKIDIVFSPYVKWTKVNARIKAQTNNPFTMPIMGSTCCGKLYKTLLLRNNNFNDKLTKAEDVELNFRLFQNKPTFLYVDKPLYYYRILADSTVRAYSPKTISEYATTFNLVETNLSEGNEQIIRASYDFAGVIYLIIMLNTIYHPDNKKPKRPQLLTLEKEKFSQVLFQHTKQLRLPITNRIAILLAKHHLFFMLHVLVNIKRRSEV